MVAISLRNIEDVRKAREWVRELARAAGLPDVGAAALVASELGNNCVEHGERLPALLAIACAPGQLLLRFENRCSHRPRWRTRKPVAVGEFRTGGYGLPLVRALAHHLSCRWSDGRAIVQAEFD
jgi:anti-sigma regulatory factor (Ser/Thr protein kinase)